MFHSWNRSTVSYMGIQLLLNICKILHITAAKICWKLSLILPHNERNNRWASKPMVYHKINSAVSPLKKWCNLNTPCTQGHTCSASDVCVSLTIELVSLSVLSFVHPFCNLSILISTQSRPTVITFDRSSCRRLEQLFCKCCNISVSVNMNIQYTSIP